MGGVAGTAGSSMVSEDCRGQGRLSTRSQSQAVRRTWQQEERSGCLWGHVSTRLCEWKWHDVDLKQGGHR